MSFTPTAPWTQTTYSASTASTAATDYKTAIDNNFMVARRMGTAFSVSEQTTAALRDMTVHVSAGWLFNGVTFTEVSAQDSTALAVPAAVSRIDRIVADILTGTISVVSGSEAITPSAPAIPAGKIPLAQIALTAETTRIGNSMITDERAVWGEALPGDYQEFLTTGAFTWNKPTGFSSNALVVVMEWGGGGAGSTISGGGGGSCNVFQTPLGRLSTAVSGSVGAGGTTAGGFSGDTNFGSFTVYGGCNGPVLGFTADPGGNGAGIFARGSTDASVLANYYGGAPLGGAGVTAAVTSSGSAIFGGGGGGDGGIFGVAYGTTGGFSVWGGGGGGGGSTGGTAAGNGGRSFYGGGGGGGAGPTAGGHAGGVSVLGGNGGAGSTVAGGSGVAGSAPAGAGGSAAPGARGEVRVWVLRG